jgi:hypothetical protein
MRKARTLLVDGEMPNALLQERLKALAGKNMPSGLEILSSEDLWRMGQPLNFNDAGTQGKFQNMLDALTKAGRKPDLILLDNKSCLTSGTDENSNSELDGLLHWLMGLRHQGYAVMIVAHTGKGRDAGPRGASRQEDFLDSSILLTAPTNLPEPARGACFTLSFTKHRSVRPTPDHLTVELTIGNNGQAEWRVVQAVSEDVRILQMVHDHAPKSIRELAALLGVAPTTASKKLGPLIASGLVANTKPISLNAKGITALNEASTASAKDSKKRFT